MTNRVSSFWPLARLSHRQRAIVIRRLQRSEHRRGRPWAQSLTRRVLITCTSLRTNMTVRELGVVFAISKSQVHRILADLTPRLAALLEPTDRDRRRSWIVDGTLVPTRDHGAAAKSKNYRWSCNVQVLVAAIYASSLSQGVALEIAMTRSTTGARRSKRCVDRTVVCSPTAGTAAFPS